MQPSPLGGPAVMHYLGREKKKQESQSALPPVCSSVRLSVRPSARLPARPSVIPGSVPPSVGPSLQSSARPSVRTAFFGPTMKQAFVSATIPRVVLFVPPARYIFVPSSNSTLLMLVELAVDRSHSHCYLGTRAYGALLFRLGHCFGACRTKREFGFGGS